MAETWGSNWGSTYSMPNLGELGRNAQSSKVASKEGPIDLWIIKCHQCLPNGWYNPGVGGPEVLLLIL